MRLRDMNRLAAGLLALVIPMTIVSVPSQAHAAASSGAGCRLTLAGYPAVRPGDRGPAVRTLQCVLNRDGYGHGLVIDGWYGPQTKAAVKRLWGHFEGYPTHPYVVKWWYWMILFASHHDLTGLRQGDRGPAVRDLQRALRAARMSLTVDGSFGPQTRSRVVEFQRACNMKQTGRVDSGTAWYLTQGGCADLVK